MITAPKDKAERDARLDATVAEIAKHPEEWNQLSTHCQTTHCVAGFAQCLAVSWPVDNGPPQWFLDGNPAMTDARVWLGLEFHQADSLFYNFNLDLDGLRRIVSEIKATPYPAPEPSNG